MGLPPLDEPSDGSCEPPLLGSEPGVCPPLGFPPVEGEPDPEPPGEVDGEEGREGSDGEDGLVEGLPGRDGA
jgi:hypothetical protein